MAHTLLLADDSVTVQRVIELTFADEGVRVIAVGDGRAAIEQIEREPPDIVLADIGMPYRDGYDVASFVKARPHLAHVPVLLLAGAFEPVDQARAAAVGCDGVLVKPFEPHLVVVRVKELLAEGASRARRSSMALMAPAAAPPGSTESADEFFARLDVAFSKLGLSSDASPIAGQGMPSKLSPEAHSVPADSAPIASRGDELVAGAPPSDPGDRLGAGEPREPGGDTITGVERQAPDLLVTAFRTVLARERGETPPATGSALPTGHRLDDEEVERIVVRVLERLNDGVLRDAARSLVAPIAERLVRDEIERIKSSR